MKCAIFHDYFGAIGGGERVALTLAEILDADIITTDIDVVEKLNPRVSVHSLGRTFKIPPFKQITASIKFYSSDVSDDYDYFIFTGNWSHYAARTHHPNLWYCYTPVRAFYDLYPAFLARQDMITRPVFRAWTGMHREFDQRSIANVDRIVAISQNVRNRILRYHHRDARVIYPPIDTDRYRCREYGGFWLSVNRLYPEKRIELQIESFRKLPGETLIIAGGFAEGDHAARYVRRITRNLPPNVSIIGEIPEDQIIDLYSRCRGFLCTAIDEDFGMTPVEAMASGKPVVAVDEGGFRETVTADTGMVVPADAGQIAGAIRKLTEDPRRYRDACLARARKFDRSVFEEQIKMMVHDAA
jgi:glycosyltransferase involved in cell wall biosynthesis